MKYAVVKTGGKQYKVSEGDILEVERLTVQPNQEFSFEEVLLYVDSPEVKIGKPDLSNVNVKAKVLENTKGEKIRVSKFKSKVRYRKTTGHRQSLTKIQIGTISQEKKK